MFGDRRKPNDQRIDTLEEQLIESHKALQLQIYELKKHCINQRQSLMALDKKLQHLCAAADGEFYEVRQSMAQTERYLSQKVEVLEVDIQRQNRLLKLGLKKIKKALSEESKQREYRIVEDLYRYYHRILRTKISKDEISEVILEICSKLETGKGLES